MYAKGQTQDLALGGTGKGASILARFGADLVPE